MDTHLKQYAQRSEAHDEHSSAAAQHSSARPSSASNAASQVHGSILTSTQAFSFNSIINSDPKSTPSSEPVSVAGSNVDEDGQDDEMHSSDESHYAPSMSSVVRDHVYEGGLRFHAYHEGQYPFPNDENEQDRDDMKHAMAMGMCEDKLHYAPIEKMMAKGSKVLDLGTGSGIWPIEFAEIYPHANVLGIDLSPMQPTLVPPNVKFLIDDMEDEWLEDANTYDYIHVRYTLCFAKDREKLMRRIYRHLKPGGYVEFQELHAYPYAEDGSLMPDTPYAVRDLLVHMEAGLSALGGCLNAILHAADELERHGFEDIYQFSHKCPIGPWPVDERYREVGSLLREAMMESSMLRAMTYKPFQLGLGWTQEEVEVFLVGVRRDLVDLEGRYNAYLPFYVVYGRKPFC